MERTEQAPVRDESREQPEFRWTAGPEPAREPDPQPRRRRSPRPDDAF